jgi:hypothetical protein
MYFIYYVLNFTSNVPLLDSVLVFFEYYVVFVLMFGLMFFLLCKFSIKSENLNVIIIAVSHVLFIIYLFHSLKNFDTGSFFDRAP